MLVGDVLARRALGELCRDSGKGLGKAVRRAVLGAIADERIHHPRRSGTLAGRYLAARCRHLPSAGQR